MLLVMVGGRGEINDFLFYILFGSKLILVIYKSLKDEIIEL